MTREDSHQEGTLASRWVTTPGFAAAGPGDTPSASAFDQLLTAVETHIANEADSLASYRRMAEQSADPTNALLLSLVLEDEERHHALLRRIAVTVRDSLYWTHSGQTLPASTAPSPEETLLMAKEVESLARHERESVQQLHQLAQQQRDIFGGLIALLLETMASDSEKHEMMLRFIQRRMTSE